MLKKYLIEDSTSLIKFTGFVFQEVTVDSADNTLYLFDSDKIVYQESNIPGIEYVDVEETKKLNPYWNAQDFWRYTGYTPDENLQGDYTDFAWPNLLKIDVSHDVLFFQSGWSQDFTVGIPNSNDPFIAMSFGDNTLNKAFWLQRKAPTNELILYISDGSGNPPTELVITSADLAGQVVRFRLVIDTGTKPFLYNSKTNKRIQVGFKSSEGLFGQSAKYTGDFSVTTEPAFQQIGGVKLYQSRFITGLLTDGDLSDVILSRMSLAPGFGALASTLSFNNNESNLPGDPDTIQEAIDSIKTLIENQPLQTSVNSFSELPDAASNNDAIIHVIDATEDPTVTSGWAKYQSIEGNWVKYVSLEDLTSSLTELTKAQLEDSNSEVQGTISGKVLNEILKEKVDDQLITKIDKPIGGVEGQIPVVNASGTDVEWKDADILPQKYRGTIENEAAVKAVTDLEDGVSYFVKDTSQVVVYNSTTKQGNFSPDDPNATGSWFITSGNSKSVYKTWEELSNPLVEGEVFVVSKLEGGENNLDKNAYYEFIVPAELEGETKGSELTIEEVDRYRLFGVAVDPRAIIDYVEIVLLNKAGSSFGYFSNARFYDIDGNLYPNTSWKVIQASESLESEIGKYGSQVNKVLPFKSFNTLRFAYVSNYPANGLGAVQGNYRADFESTILYRVTIKTDTYTHTENIQRLDPTTTFTSNTKIDLNPIKDFTSVNTFFDLTSQHDLGQETIQDLKSSTGIQAYLEGGPGYIIKAENYVDNFSASITNTTSTERPINFSGFAEVVMRDGEAINLITGSGIQVPANTRLLLHIYTKEDGLKYLDFVPQGSSTPLSSQDFKAIEVVGSWEGSGAVGNEAFATINTGIDLTKCSQLILTWADTSRDSISGEWTWSDIVDVASLQASQKVLINRYDNSYIWLRIKSSVTGELEVRTEVGPTGTHLIKAVGQSEKLVKSSIIQGAVNIIDEDDFASNDPTKAPSQQSVKAYIENNKIDLLDEDDFASNSDTQAPTQQSVKAYVDTKPSLRGTPVSDLTALTALTAKDFEIRRVTSTGDEYVFEVGATPNNLNPADDAATGAWVLVPTATESDALLGQTFFSTNNRVKQGLCYAGQTYNWSDNPKLKALFDANNHDFITDNGDGTFTVVDHNDFIRAGVSNIGTHVDDTTAVNGLRDTGHTHTQRSGDGGGNADGTTAQGTGVNNQQGFATEFASANLVGDAETAPDHRTAYFGIYGDIVVLTAPATLAEVLDEDDLASNSDTKVPTQQSVKAYVDNKQIDLLDEDDFASDAEDKPASQQSTKAYIQSVLPTIQTVQLAKARLQSISAFAIDPVGGDGITLNLNTVAQTPNTKRIFNSFSINLQGQLVCNKAATYEIRAGWFMYCSSNSGTIGGHLYLNKSGTWSKIDSLVTHAIELDGYGSRSSVTVSLNACVDLDVGDMIALNGVNNTGLGCDAGSLYINVTEEVLSYNVITTPTV